MSTVKLEDINDESTLSEMLEEESDLEKRSSIRARLMEVKKQKRQMRETQAQRREDDRDKAIKNKAAQADLQKQRTLEMYSAMAKSAPAGSAKVMDVGIYKRGEAGEGIVTSVNQGLVEDAIKETAKQRELEKKRMLAAFEAAAKSGQAGAPKEVDFEAFKKADVSDFDFGRKDYDPTMQVSGGIPMYNPDMIRTPATGSVSCMNGPDFGNASKNLDQPMDAMQRAIKGRQEACDAEKKRILAAYAVAAKQGPGPKQNVLDEFRNVKLNELESATKSVPSSCAGFKGGVPLEQTSEDSKVGLKSTCFNPAKLKQAPALNIRRSSLSTYSLSPVSSPPSVATPASVETSMSSGYGSGVNLHQAAKKLQEMDSIQKSLQERNEAAEIERKRILAAYIAKQQPKGSYYSRETTPARDSTPLRGFNRESTPSRNPSGGGSTAFRPVPIRPPRPLK